MCTDIYDPWRINPVDLVTFLPVPIYIERGTLTVVVLGEMSQ